MRTIACGFTADIDLISTLSQPFYEEIKEASKEGAHKAVIHTWADFCAAVDWNVQKGSGAEYIVADPSILDHLEKKLDWRKAIGGGGLQAGCVASYAGYGALVNVPKISEELRALVSEYKRLELLSDQKGHVPKHYILEYDTGCSSNRIIFRKYHEYPSDMVATEFVNEIKNRDVSWMLIAGYNAVDGSKEVDLLLNHTIKMLETLGNKKPKVHLELASIWSLDEQWKIIRTLGCYVDSLGVNEDEYRELIGLKDTLLNREDQELIRLTEEASQKLGISHVILHTKEFSLIQSSHYDTSMWESALKNGNQFAFTRAVAGKIGNQEAIRQITARAEYNQRGVSLQKITRDRTDITVMPAYMGKTVSATGLGDTFTAGLLVKAPVEWKRV